ncbi:MAG: hypothetical protein PF488_03995, partial [Patescibacteria group bacterium]|nr:hypothetical protein [Patescibacteria group bacterium]
DYVIGSTGIGMYRLWGMLTESASYLITGVNVNLTRLINLLTGVTSYTITGINATFSRLINLISSVTEYTITGISVGLLRPIRNMAVNVSSYIITTFPVIFRGIGDWLWSWITKPSSSYNNSDKPSDSTWNNKNKVE